MQDSPLLSDIDLLSIEHSIDTIVQTSLLSQLHEETNGLISYEVLRIIKIDSDGFDCHALTACNVVCKEFPEMKLPNL
jgi:hypothetical protein